MCKVGSQHCKNREKYKLPEVNARLGEVHFATWPRVSSFCLVSVSLKQSLTKLRNEGAEQCDGGPGFLTAQLPPCSGIF